MDMVGEKVEVKGTVKEDMGEKEITVESFNVMK
jgi:DNA/RNA endonuclease YhcR with UshA esterase domain